MGSRKALSVEAAGNVCTDPGCVWAGVAPNHGHEVASGLGLVIEGERRRRADAWALRLKAERAVCEWLCAPVARVLAEGTVGT